MIIDTSEKQRTNAEYMMVTGVVMFILGMAGVMLITIPKLQEELSGTFVLTVHSAEEAVSAPVADE